MASAATLKLVSQLDFNFPTKLNIIRSLQSFLAMIGVFSLFWSYLSLTFLYPVLIGGFIAFTLENFAKKYNANTHIVIQISLLIAGTMLAGWGMGLSVGASIATLPLFGVPFLCFYALAKKIVPPLCTRFLTLGYQCATYWEWVDPSLFKKVSHREYAELVFEFIHNRSEVLSEAIDALPQGGGKLIRQVPYRFFILNLDEKCLTGFIATLVKMGANIEDFPNFMALQQTAKIALIFEQINETCSKEPIALKDVLFKYQDLFFVAPQERRIKIDTNTETIFFQASQNTFKKHWDLSKQIHAARNQSPEAPTEFLAQLRSGF